MLLYDNPHYTIKYHAPFSLVEIIWHGFVTSEQLQDGFNNVLKVIHEKRASFLLADAQRMNALKASDQTWIKNNLFPALSANGLKKYARITNSDVFTQAIISNLMKVVREEKQYKFILESFYDRDDALEWILSDYSQPAHIL